MSLREAAQQALEALEVATTPLAKDRQEVLRAREALRTALAEPETEAETYKRLYELRGKALERPCFHCGYKPEKIYPMEQRTEPEQEPVAYVTGAYAGHFTVVPTNPALVLTTGMALYTHPPQRKPLTDEEIGKIILETEITLKNYCDVDLQTDFARRIERAHGIGGEA